MKTINIDSNTLKNVDELIIKNNTLLETIIIGENSIMGSENYLGNLELSSKTNLPLSKRSSFITHYNLSKKCFL